MLLRESVARQLNGEPVGAFLSGGTDSSTISGLLGEITGEPARTYSIGFDAEGYDETRYARIAARHFGMRHQEYYVTPEDVARAIPAIGKIHSEPFGNSSAIPTYYCAKLAREDGISRLLAGDGGDELFGGNARYATQRLFSFYEQVPRWMRARLIEPVVFGIPAGDHILPVRKLRGYLRQALKPAPERMEFYNLIERIGIDKVLEPDFRAAVDISAPLAHLTEIYNEARAGTMLNRALALDHKLTLADNDLPKVSRSCELAGLDVAFPMLDDELMEFAQRLPVGMKLRGFRLRYFFKEALRDYLPPEILTKTKHGFGLPYGPWLMSNRALREISFDSLAGLKRRGIVRPQFVDELVEMLLPQHAGFYGTFVWLLVMLEQWYRNHDHATRPAN
jgi:asparagine synthase (glutamine-hydrolysing)